MKLTHWLTKQVIVARLATTSGNKMAYITTTAFHAQIQPLSLEKARLVDGVYGQAFKFYVDHDADVSDGDHLRDEDNNTYKVKKGGITTRSMGSIEYKELICEKMN